MTFPVPDMLQHLAELTILRPEESNTRCEDVSAAPLSSQIQSPQLLPSPTKPCLGWQFAEDWTTNGSPVVEKGPTFHDRFDFGLSASEEVLPPRDKLCISPCSATDLAAVAAATGVDPDSPLSNFCGHSVDNSFHQMQSPRRRLHQQCVRPLVIGDFASQASVLGSRSLPPASDAAPYTCELPLLNINESCAPSHVSLPSSSDAVKVNSPDLSTATQLPGLVSPALLAQALSVLGANPGDSLALETSSSEESVMEAAQLLAQLLKAADGLSSPGLVNDRSPTYVDTQFFPSPNAVDASPANSHHSLLAPSFSTQSWANEGDRKPLRAPLSLPLRRESTYSASTPRSPIIARPPPLLPDKEDKDASQPPRVWTPTHWDCRSTTNSLSSTSWNRCGDAFLADAMSPKRIDSASGSLTNWSYQEAVSPSHNPVASTDVSSQGRSTFLQDFRNGGIQLVNLYQVDTYMYEFARDQVGARFIQQRLSCCCPQEAWFARSILLPRLKGLVTDVFGNHIVQRLIESGTPQQRHQIFQQMQGDILRFSLQTYGCRVLQKALEALSLEDKLAFARELQNHVVRCVEDQNGNHVIQKCIERVPPAHMQFVIDSFQGQVARVSVHCYGCRVVQRVLEHCPYEQINDLLNEIMDDFVRLAQDQYGNYVVQHVLRYGRPSDKRTVVERIAKDLQLLASHKFSSNVVEKCLEVCTSEEARRAIIRAAFGDNNDPRPPIMQMVRDRYANYVVQRMIDVTIQDGQESLIDEVIIKLEKHMPALKKFTYGKHIAAALERLRKQNEELRSQSTA